jgi:hypothetical protein
MRVQGVTGSLNAHTNIALSNEAGGCTHAYVLNIHELPFLFMVF